MDVLLLLVLRFGGDYGGVDELLLLEVIIELFLQIQGPLIEKCLLFVEFTLFEEELSLCLFLEVFGLTQSLPVLVTLLLRELALLFECAPQLLQLLVLLVLTILGLVLEALQSTLIIHALSFVLTHALL